MSASPDRLYELLPAVHRIRDAERGFPLRALLRVIGEQVEVIEQDIDRLYDNWFIETCEDWVVPYIGDLIGYRPLQPGSHDSSATKAANLHKILIPRRDVASTLGSRRRKGTLALLETLARDVADWPARAVEFYALLGWTQHLNHQHPDRGKTVGMRDSNALDLMDGPFDRLAHTVDVRRIQSRRSPGRHNIPSVGVFVWRLKHYSVTHSPAYCVESEGAQCFTFSALGIDTSLFTKPEPEAEPAHIAEEINLPAAVRRSALEERIGLRPLTTRAAGIYYGAGKSIAIYAPDWPSKGAPQPIPAEFIIPADLSDWRYRAGRRQVALDPVLGRFLFPARQLPKHGVWVTYHYAFSANMGGGEYSRRLSQPINYRLYRVSKDKPSPDTFTTIAAAFAKWRTDQQALGSQSSDPGENEKWQDAREELRAAVVEIEDSAVYAEPIKISLEQGESFQLRAANRARPVLRLIDFETNRADAMEISGKKGSRFKLDGITVTGQGLRVSGPDRSDAQHWEEGDLCDVIIRHSTLVPAPEFEQGCDPERQNQPGLEIVHTSAKIVVETSIIHSIRVVADEVQADPVELSISDSIIDAGSQELIAIGASNLPLAFADLSIARSTVIGKVNIHALSLGENSIFMGLIRVGRRQRGCARFCYITPGSRTPQRFHCEPDRAIAVLDEVKAPRAPTERARAAEREAQRVRPHFESLKYGSPAYCQLAMDCADEISRGAEDESEMGVFHNLFNPQRTANLRARLEEYTPAGMEAAILFEN
jgi:hypothetical protein